MILRGGGSNYGILISKEYIESFIQLWIFDIHSPFDEYLIFVITVERNVTLCVS